VKASPEADTPNDMTPKDRQKQKKKANSQPQRSLRTTTMTIINTASSPIRRNAGSPILIRGHWMRAAVRVLTRYVQDLASLGA
ncbi:MAG: hypothetical protein ACKPKO_15780, partial [Candidatus Fonsibacter sp.]